MILSADAVAAQLRAAVCLVRLWAPDVPAACMPRVNNFSLTGLPLCLLLPASFVLPRVGHDFDEVAFLEAPQPAADAIVAAMRPQVRWGTLSRQGRRHRCCLQTVVRRMHRTSPNACTVFNYSTVFALLIHADPLKCFSVHCIPKVKKECPET